MCALQPVHAGVALELLEEVEHLRLVGHVERRHGLVEHHELRVGGQGPGDREALELPAGELPGVAVEVVRAHPDHLDELLEAASSRRSVEAEVDVDGLADAASEGEARVEGRVRVLKDHLDAPGCGSGRLTGPADHGLPGVSHGPGGGGEQADGDAPEGGLPGAALADEADGLPGADREVHVVDGVDPARDAAEQAGAHGEPLGDLVEVEEGRGVEGAHRTGSCVGVTRPGARRQRTSWPPPSGRSSTDALRPGKSSPPS